MSPAEDSPAAQELEILDISELGPLLRQRRGALSIRQAAADANVSFSTWSRVESGSQPDLATFTLLCAWLGIPPSRFFTPAAPRRADNLEHVIAHLQADPRLSTDASKKIGAMLRTMYEALAQDVHAPPPVACHLRAKTLMRPGVPARLAALMTDMRDELERRIEDGTL